MKLVSSKFARLFVAAKVVGFTAGFAAVAGQARAQPTVYADSVADFSGIQSQKNWYYGFYDGDSAPPWSFMDFEPFPSYDLGVGPVWYRTLGTGGYWTAINALAMHPNGAVSVGGRVNEENWAVRRWSSTVRGPVRIIGHVADVAADGGDGVRCKLIVQGVERWSHDLDAGDTAGVDFDVSACMFLLSTFDFAVGPRGDSEFSDGTYTSIKVQSIIDQQPADRYACNNQPVTMSVVIGGSGTYSYAWYHNGEIIQPATAASLTIQNPTQEDEGQYSCVISDTCGSVTTSTATLTVCRIDLNCDTFVDFNDYLEFLNRYDISDPRADLNGDGFVDFVDYLEFLNLYEAGC